MQMTDEEVRRSYRQAKDKQNQIQVLAELNLCKQEKIRQILEDSGDLISGTHPMTDEEICRSYQEAGRNRQNQIKKLARINHYSVGEIRRILIENGALVPKPPKKAETAVPETAVQKQESDAVPADWKTSLKTVTERIVELKLIRDNAEKELSEIYQTLGALCGKE